MRSRHGTKFGALFEQSPELSRVDRIEEQREILVADIWSIPLNCAVNVIGGAKCSCKLR